MPPAGLEPAIPASERPQTHNLGRAATGVGRDFLIGGNNAYVTLYLGFQERNPVKLRRPL
jgi:hypothetical protein